MHNSALQLPDLSDAGVRSVVSSLVHHPRAAGARLGLQGVLYALNAVAVVPGRSVRND